ncbi:tetratricopeptide repeat protein [candidate division CSSED10-310 bacterium]|uniref:Tetratricopeptide repeat protein n=1 Tax=candidate division CSSED10-310 bacterium TaxID=2855610 RepID=A0ABV6YV55_UNCC1
MKSNCRKWKTIRVNPHYPCHPRSIFSIICILIIILATPTFAQDPMELFRSGNKAYENGKYDQAIQSYSSIVNAGLQNAHVYYNLGNAYFKKGNLASAILFYEKARKFAPRDQDINQNLKFALAQTRDKIEKANKSIVFAFFKTIHDYFSLNEWTIFFTILVNLLFLLFIFRLLLKSPLLRDINFYFLVITSCLLCVTLIFFAVKISSTLYTTRAVIMEAQIDVHSGPAKTYTTLLKVHEGTRLEIILESKDWFQVRFDNGYVGWLPKNTVALI